MKFYLLCLIFLFTALVTVVCSGSISHQRVLGPTAAAAIRNGHTTKAQVRALLGPPQTIETRTPIPLTAGTAPLPAKYTAAEIWVFSAVRNGRSTSLPFDSSAKNGQPRYFVIVYFDGQGVVLDCQTEMTGS
jgi:hypothetical protein